MQVRPMLKRVSELPDTVRKSREGVTAALRGGKAYLCREVTR